MLWNALSKWITPKSVKILQQYRSELFVKDHEEKYTPVVSYEATTTMESSSEYGHAHSSDISISRCEGFMSMIKMNLSKAISDLGYNNNSNNNNK